MDFLTKLERLAFAINVLRININGRIERYGKILSAIEKEEENPELLEESLSLSNEEKAEFVRVLREMYITLSSANTCFLDLTRVSLMVVQATTTDYIYRTCIAPEPCS